MNFDYTLYLVTDRQLMSCDSLTEAVEQAILGGCTMIQLREKELSSLEFYNQAVAVKQVTDKYHIPLVGLLFATYILRAEYVENCEYKE